MGATVELRPMILVVDDESKNLLIMESLLAPLGYRVACASSGEESLEVVKRDPPDLVLLDVMMPGMDGYAVCKALKSDEETRLIPVIMVSALCEVADKVRALDCDADDFLTKPVNRHELTARVRSCLRIKALNDRLESSESVLFAFAKAVEAKDPYTTGHSERVSRFATDLARDLGFPRDLVDEIERGGLLHDIGKIGVPDAVLRKPGKLTPEEFDVVKRHTVVGEQICAPLRSFGGVLSLIRSHHERLDGSGYPDGLAAGQIPAPVRVLSIADMFDALASARPYRSNVETAEVERIFREEVDRGKLDRELVERAVRQFVGWATVVREGTSPVPAGAE